VTTLDAFCSEKSISRVDMLKVDVEGGELGVFQGAQQLLAQRDAPIVMFEVGDVLAERFGTSPSHVKRLLEARNYGVFRFDGAKLRRVNTSDSHPSSEDLFAVRPSHFRERPLLQDLVE
jgi:hypothetical protein